MTPENSPKNNQIDDMQKILNMKRKTSSSTKWAMVLTGVWAAVVLILGYITWPQLVLMPPNEWGDFLAGTFSPLALLWLVAGYRQQGDELFLNTKALLMQQVEMKNQVEEFKKLAKHAEIQAETAVAMRVHAEEEAIRANAKEIEVRREHNRPDFNLSITTMGIDSLWVEMRNLGGDARDVTVESDFFTSVVLSGDLMIFRRGTTRKLELIGMRKDPDRSPFLTITCSDKDDEKYSFHFVYDKPRNAIVSVPLKKTDE